MAAAMPLTETLTMADAFSRDDTDERSLAARACRGDRDAFADLVRRTQGPVFGLCYRLLNDREGAADAAQETFARAYAALSSLDPDQRFELWVLRIARNHCYDQLRRKGFLPTPDEDATLAAPDPAPTAQERMEKAEESRGLEDALTQLPLKDREILALYYVQRRKTKDIASIQGVAPGTIMARLFRAREKLRRLLREKAA